MTGEVLSLADYAAKRGARHTSGAWIDTLPPEVYEEIAAYWQSGGGYTVIIEWLKDKGYADVTAGKLAQLSNRFPRG